MSATCYARLLFKPGINITHNASWPLSDITLLIYLLSAILLTYAVVLTKLFKHLPVHLPREIQ